MIIGYARVSTDAQDTQLQKNALRIANCEKIFEETQSGSRWDRIELNKMLEQIREGDVIVVYKLDRLSRSLRDLIFIIEMIEKAGAGFKSLTEAIDTTTVAGKMMFHIIGAFAQYERSILKERTAAGLANSRKHGRIGGRKSKLSSEQKNTVAELLVQGKSGADIAKIFNVSPATISRLKANS